MDKYKGQPINNQLKSATLCLHRGDLPTASKQAELSLAASPRMEGSSLWSFRFIRAEVLRMTGRISEALEYLQSLEPTPTEYEESCLCRQMHTGYCLALLGSHTEARLLLEGALAIALRLDILTLQIEVQARIAMLEFLSNQLDRAEAIYKDILLEERE